MGTRKPKKFPVSTTKAMAACAAHGLTYHGGTGSQLTAVDDRQSYHRVRVRVSGGTATSAHVCGTERAALAAALTHTAQRAALAGRLAPHRETEFSREAARLELGLICPSWVCDVDSEFTPVADTDEALAQVWLEGRPE